MRPAAAQACLTIVSLAITALPCAAWWDEPFLDGPPAVIAGGHTALWHGPAQLADLPGASAVMWYAEDADEQKRIGGAVFVPIPVLGNRLFDPSLVGVVARDVGVDPALAYAIVAVESGFNPRAVSITGARGLMQLTSRTARAMGVYNRFSPRWNLRGGMRYLKKLLGMYGGDVPLAVAAYTLGPTGMKRELGGDSARAAGHPYVKKVLAYREKFRGGLRTSAARGGHVIALGGYSLADSSEMEAVVGWGYRLHSLLSLGALGRVPRHETALWFLSGHLCLLDYLEGAFSWRAGSEEFEGSAALVSGNGKMRLAAEADWEGNVRGGLSVVLFRGLSLWGSAGEHRGAAGAELSLGALSVGYAAGLTGWDWGENTDRQWHRASLSLRWR